MDAEIYIDVVFLINFIMDFFIFWIAGKLARMKTSIPRLALGSGITALLYCMLAFLPFFRTYYNFFTTLAVLMLGLLITFGPKTPGAMLLLVIYSNISAFAVGGAAFALFYYTNLGSLIGNLTFSLRGLSFKILIAASCSSYVLLKLLLWRLGKITVKKQSFYNVVILIEGKEISLTALLDTGNSLLDPLTNEPVIIAEFGGLKDLLPDDVKIIFLENREEELLELMNAFSRTPFIKRVRIIPFCSVGKQNGMLIGFKPDGIRVSSLDSDDVTTKDAIVGIYNYSLSADGSFRALLNPSVLA